MHVVQTCPIPDVTKTHIRVYACPACGHELRLTVWGAEQASEDALPPSDRRASVLGAPSSISRRFPPPRVESRLDDVESRSNPTTFTTAARF
jgi:hypothetical protein